MAMKCLKTETEVSAHLFDKKELPFSLSSLVFYFITRGTGKNLCLGPTQLHPTVLYTPKSSTKATGNKTPVGHSSSNTGSAGRNLRSHTQDTRDTDREAGMRLTKFPLG